MEANLNDSQNFVERLRRSDFLKQEESIVVSPGARANGWAIEVTGHVAYNVYKVRTVAVTDPGELPTLAGNEMEATNLAEDFLNEGQLPIGTYALMLKPADKYVFYAKV